ncbi:Trypanosome variant surface glycoprotein (A-type), putative [Trypanosoma equiperdum]|uniref:Trypanosome variant surface glycoprotein (A-type), putative n=1 Tax=Trypanosoma equiperdum TaxID=5694 RepID=A0A1G4I9U9_TRYEQ|nr:Trypanosome variant surface glycoprotein (A-type), putative [Trypanosoma equiperdum]
MHIKTALSSAEQAVAAATKTRQQHTLVLIAEPSYAKAAKIFFNFATSRLTEAQQALNKLTAETAEYAVKASYAAGRVDELMLILDEAQRGSENTNYCIRHDSNDATADKSPTAGCIAAFSQACTKTAANLNIKLTAAFKKDASTEHGTASKCKLTETVSTAFGRDRGNFDLPGGMLVIASAGDFEGDSFKAYALSKPPVDGLKKERPADEAFPTVAAGPPTTKTGILAILQKGSQPPELETAVKNYYGWDANHNDDAVQTEITKIFGLSEDGTKSTYLDVLEKLGYKQKSDTAADPIKLFEMNEEMLVNATNAATATNLKAKAAAKPCTAAKAPKDAEELCNGKSGDANSCNETAGCNYNSTGEANKKCTLKKEMKAQLEKASQETGGKDGKLLPIDVPNILKKKMAKRKTRM